jgi:DNA polymerase I-like protein with 3'-5' exonuclease and polymerase domains
MILFDLETDGLLDELTCIHTIHAYDTETDTFLRFNDGKFSDGSPAVADGTIADGIELISRADSLAGHNIIGFDLIAIRKLYPDFRHTANLHDTLIYTRLIYPHLSEIDAKAIRKRKRPEGFGKFVGSNKLEAWGMRLGEHKGEFKGPWDKFTPEMEEYAAQDVVVTKKLWELVSSKGLCEETIRLEHRVAEIINWQERYGFKFDTEAAEKLQFTLIGRKAELEDTLMAVFPPWVEPVRKGGKPEVFIPKRDNARLGYTAGVPVTKIKTVAFNPGSRDHIANRMTKLFGWRPTEFTETGKPKVDETTLAGLDYPEAKLLIEYLTVDKRLGQLAEGKQAWLKSVKYDGRVHGRVNTLGAITRRMTHSTPNVAQVPAVGAPWGSECRSLFIADRGFELVGCDAEGLELRMLAHYMAKYDGGAYGETVVNGKQSDGTDVHTVNQWVVGLNTRNSAKTFIYGYLYGAGNHKLGSIIYDDYTDKQREGFNKKNPAGDARDRALSRIGRKARTNIEEGLPALGKVQEAVKKAAARGCVKAIEGGVLRVRSEHSALNTLLQGGGAILMKKALVLFVDALEAEGWEFSPLTGQATNGKQRLGLVANIHDEFQVEVEAGLGEYIGTVAAEAIRKAGEAYSLRCPMAGAFKVGSNWAKTH